MLHTHLAHQKHNHLPIINTVKIHALQVRMSGQREGVQSFAPCHTNAWECQNGILTQATCPLSISYNNCCIIKSSIHVKVCVFIVSSQQSSSWGTKEVLWALVIERRNSGYIVKVTMKFPGNQPHIYFKYSVDVNHTFHFFEISVIGYGSDIF